MSFTDYLSSLPAIRLDRLYQSRWTCQAVLRSLPPLAKQYVLRLLFVENEIKEELMKKWIHTDSLHKHNASLERLLALRIFLPEQKIDNSYRMNPSFQKGIKESLLFGGILPRKSLSKKVAFRLPSISELEKFAVERWESVLLQLVKSSTSSSSSLSSSSSSSSTNVNDIVLKTFLQSKLINMSQNSTPRITDKGFQFLLMETKNQQWLLIQEYINFSEERGVDSVELIQFLLELGFHHIGKPYHFQTLSSLQERAVEEFEIFGLVKIQKGMSDRWFIPTNLAANLCSNLSEEDTWQESEGFIVIETNFRLYAYTSSKLQIEILKLFLDIEYILPNLLVGVLSRKSLNDAFVNGITAHQIVKFLRSHSHPYVSRRKPVIPETVIDQIHLWEKDRNRVKASPSVLYDNFPTKEVFLATLTFAKELEGVLWEEPKKGKFIAHGEKHEQIRNFIRKQSSSSATKRKSVDK